MTACAFIHGRGNKRHKVEFPAADETLDEPRRLDIERPDAHHANGKLAATPLRQFPVDVAAPSNIAQRPAQNVVVGGIAFRVKCRRKNAPIAVSPCNNSRLAGHGRTPLIAPSVYVTRVCRNHLKLAVRHGQRRHGHRPLGVADALSALRNAEKRLGAGVEMYHHVRNIIPAARFAEGEWDEARHAGTAFRRFHGEAASGARANIPAAMRHERPDSRRALLAERLGHQDGPSTRHDKHIHAVKRPSSYGGGIKRCSFNVSGACRQFQPPENTSPARPLARIDRKPDRAVCRLKWFTQRDHTRRQRDGKQEHIACAHSAALQ